MILQFQPTIRGSSVQKMCACIRSRIGSLSDWLQRTHFISAMLSSVIKPAHRPRTHRTDGDRPSMHVSLQESDEDKATIIYTSVQHPCWTCSCTCVDESIEIFNQTNRDLYIIISGDPNAVVCYLLYACAFYIRMRVWVCIVLSMRSMRSMRWRGFLRSGDPWFVCTHS